MGRGESPVPDLDFLVALSEMYGVTLDELVLGDAPRPARESTPAEERDEAFIRARKKRVFLKAALVFVLAVGGVGAAARHRAQRLSGCSAAHLDSVVHTARGAASRRACRLLPLYSEGIGGRTFFPVPFASGLVYLALHYLADTDAAWLAFLAIPIYYMPAALYTLSVIRSRKRGAANNTPKNDV